MEKLQKQSECKTAALTQYKPPSVESMAVLLAQLKAAYPNQSVTAESAELYLTELASIHRAVGQRRLVAALTAVMRESKFFPTVAELWDHIPPAEPRQDETLSELRELEKQKAAGVKFFSLADVLKTAPEKAVVKPMPTVKTIWPDIDPNKNAEKLRQQAEELMKRETK